jgi:NAD(P)-dependent dehydrogenase (short-subunit alcohol dehydrogenase family)
MDLELSGRVAMISGASKGIGRAIANLLAQEGAMLSICARGASDLHAAAAQIEENYGISVLTHQGDMADPATVAAWVEATITRFGQIDIVVNNAGSPPPGKFIETGDEIWHAAFAAKPYGYIRLARAALPHLAQTQGAIVNIIGNAGHQPLPNFMIGGVADAALMNFTKALANDVVATGVRVNAVSPGFVRTERWSSIAIGAGRMLGAREEDAEKVLMSTMPMGRPAEMNEIAKAVAFLASSASSYITGVTLTIDGAATRGVGA